MASFIVKQSLFENSFVMFHLKVVFKAYSRFMKVLSIKVKCRKLVVFIFVLMREEAVMVGKEETRVADPTSNVSFSDAHDHPNISTSNPMSNLCRGIV